MAESSSRLETEIRQLFDDEGVVLLSFSGKGHGGRLMLKVIADRRRESLTIDDCVNLSRQIQYLIQEKKLLNEDYRLEVGSPGLDFPLREEWQFVKNLSRLLKVTIPGEKGPREISGRLTAVGDGGITLKTEKTEWKLRVAELLSVRVLPEFKPPRME